jgi:hypothetical protein
LHITIGRDEGRTPASAFARPKSAVGDECYERCDEQHGHYKNRDAGDGVEYECHFVPSVLWARIAWVRGLRDVARTSVLANLV